MGKKGGKREGAGRKAGSVNEETKILRQLRERITEDDFDLALNTLRYAMRQRKNLKVAASTAQFIIEQKAGRAAQSIQHTAPDGFEVTIRSVT